MAAAADLETDQEPGAPHPRRTYVMVGHESAEQTLAAAFSGARPHHAWMIAGPKGVGKASLAYRAARVLLGAAPNGPRPFDVSPDDPVARRIDQRAHPDLLVIRCGLNDRGKARREITVDEARALSGFFALQPAEGGWRVAIIDALDDLNRSAANAILKSVEEPPARAIVLMVCHAPGAVLATIRSRARRLALRPLSETAMAQALSAGAADEAAIRLAAGRPGRAIALAAQKAGDAERALQEALGMAVRGRPLALMQVSANGNDARAGLLLELMKAAAWRCACAGQGVGPVDTWMGRLAQPELAARWAQAFAEIAQLEQQFDGLDMDANLAVSRGAGVLLSVTG